MTKLRECPFCGEPATVQRRKHGSTVYCANEDCGVSVEADAALLETAAAMWNRRPGERAAAEAMRDLLAACKGLIQWMLTEDALRRIGLNPEQAMKDYHFAKEVIAKVDGR